MSLRNLVAVVVPFLAACGGTAVDISGEGPERSSSSGGSTGTGGGSFTGGSSGGESSSGGNSSGGSSIGGSANTCESFDDEAPRGLEVLIVNQRSTSIFLGPRQATCGIGPLFHLADESGNPMRWFTDGCSSTCADLRDHGYTSCPAICLHPSIFELAPGESHPVFWSGLVQQERTLPIECVTHNDGPTEDTLCGQAKRIQPGVFTFGAEAGTEVDCSATFDAGSCIVCPSSGGEGSSSPDVTVGGEVLTAEVTVNLDDSYGVSRDLEDDSDVPDPGQDPIGAINNVEIIFKD